MELFYLTMFAASVAVAALLLHFRKKDPLKVAAAPVAPEHVQALVEQVKSLKDRIDVSSQVQDVHKELRTLHAKYNLVHADVFGPKRDAEQKQVPAKPAGEAAVKVNT